MTTPIDLARENGFSHIGFVPVSDLNPLEDVRDMCKSNYCGQYCANWACPPACGSIENARERISRYNTCIIVQSTLPIADEYDYDGMRDAEIPHKRRFTDFARQMRLLCPGCLPLTAGACTLCRKCTYPAQPSRYPQKRLYSMEALGLLVSDVCAHAHLSYNYAPCTITYTSCVLYNTAEEPQEGA